MFEKLLKMDFRYGVLNGFIEKNILFYRLIY